MSNNVTLAGGGLIVQTALGFINVDAAVTVPNSHQDIGVALSADFDSIAFTPFGGPETSLKLSGEALSKNFAPNGQAPPDYRLDLSAALVQRWSSDVSTMIGASYLFGFEPIADKFSLDLSVSRSIDAVTTMSLSAGLEHSFDEDEASSFALFRIGYRLNDATQLGYSLDAHAGRSVATVDHQSGHGVGAWSFSGEAESAPSDSKESSNRHGLGGSLQYTANRAEISVSHDRDFLRLGSTMLSERSSLRVGSAFAFADDKVAIGRPISNGFAIVDAHRSLDGKTISIGAGPDSASAFSDIFGPVLVPDISPYSSSRLAYDVDDLPLGYDLGTGVFEIFAAHRSGYQLTVGSDATVMARGVLVDATLKPISLVTGVIRSKSASKEKTIDIFTTESGVFFAQGLSPGAWIIEIGSDPKLLAEFVIPDDINGVLELNQLKASP
ncbi:MAG: hypothetical protein H7Y09_03175 [Chitinophagaceae bacterium]|nr:hypothetical protein [Anaerolineae bacterium]